jgi:hypothetical protein
MKAFERVNELLSTQKTRTTRPADAFTIIEYATYSGVTANTARTRLRTLLEAGKVTQVAFVENGKQYKGWILNESAGDDGGKKTLALRDKARSARG